MVKDDEEALIIEAKNLKQQILDARIKVNDATLKDKSNNIPSLDRIVVKLRKQLRGHMSKVNAIDWLNQENSAYLLSASQDGYLMVWNTLSTNKVAAIPLRCSWVMACAYAPGGNLVASGGLDDVCSIFSLKTDSGTPAFKKELLGHTAYISCCKFIEDNKILTSSGDKTCILWDVESGKSLNTFVGHQEGVMSVSPKPDSNDIFCSGGCDNLTKIWDARTNVCVQTYEGHVKDVNAVNFFPNGNAVGTASEDGTSRLFDLRSDQEIMVYDSNLVNNGSEFLTSVSFSKSGRLIFCGRWDHSVQIHDTLKGDPLLNIAAHDNLVQCIAISPNGHALASGSWDTFIKIWA